MRKDPTRPSEDDEARTFVEYLELVRVPFSHISNETPAVTMTGRNHETGRPVWKKNFKTLRRLHQLGVRSGVPDYIIPFAGVLLLFVELKVVTGGVTGKKQKTWCTMLSSIQNVEAKVCHGAAEAIAFVEAARKIALRRGWQPSPPTE